MFTASKESLENSGDFAFADHPGAAYS